ncbi:MAG: MerR family transcriptional regulator [Vicinamibacterales bacterium]
MSQREARPLGLANKVYCRAGYVVMPAPKREVMKAAEVCEVANVQPYVLRSWEAEFPQLGQASSGSGVRVYRRSDIELVLRIKALVFGEGLTLAGARRRLEEDEIQEAEDTESADMDDLLGAEARDRVRFVRDGLKGILQMLDANGPTLVLAAPVARGEKSNGKRRRQVR